MISDITEADIGYQEDCPRLRGKRTVGCSSVRELAQRDLLRRALSERYRPDHGREQRHEPALLQVRDGGRPVGPAPRVGREPCLRAAARTQSPLPVLWCFGPCSWRLANLGHLEPHDGHPLHPDAGHRGDEHRRGTGLFGSGAERPNYSVGGGDLPASQRSISRWFNVGAFSIPQTYTWGNCGPYNPSGSRFLQYGPRDTPQLQRHRTSPADVPMGDVQRLQPREFLESDASIGAATAGQISGTQPARSIQMSLKAVF